MLKKTAYYLSHWEDWHWLAKYIPIMPAWCWYCIKARSLWFFTPSNPTLTFGGFLGETKREMYEQLPISTYPTSTYISTSFPFERVKEAFKKNGFSYPIAVKPDAGMMGFMFRKIRNEEELQSYHRAMKVDYIIQEFVNYPIEVSVFYYRLPNEEKGTITGFLKKEFLQVTGNGVDTLLELIKNYDRVSFRLEEMKNKHKDHLGAVIPLNETFCLSPALNLSRGGKLISLAFEKDDRLTHVFDQLSQYTQSFFYGRYDIKCQSIEELKEGKRFSILEYNGSGAEPHHVYGDGNTLFQAYRILLHHWKMLYKISRINYKRGVPYWTFSRGIKHSLKARKHFKLLSQLDANYQI